MNDPLFVRFMDGRANLFENVQCPTERKSFLLFEDLAKRTAVEILHHEVCDTAVRSIREPEIRDIHDIRMSQPPCCTSFTTKTFDDLRPLHILRSNDLDRHRPLGSDVRCKVDGTHTAAAEFAFD